MRLTDTRRKTLPDAIQLGFAICQNIGDGAVTLARRSGARKGLAGNLLGLAIGEFVNRERGEFSDRGRVILDASTEQEYNGEQ